MNKKTFILVGLFAISSALFAERIPGQYIVELTSEPVADHAARLGRQGMKSAGVAAHRTRLRSEHSQMRVHLEGKQARVLGSVDTVANAMFVEVDDASAAQLASIPGVKRVVPVRSLHMILDRAAAVHQLTEAQNLVGADVAGAGIKIGIIDSGIEIAHPGFQDSSLVAPNSFPRSDTTANLAYTTNKIIVARSYVSLLPGRDPDTSPRDRVGHGTALAMVAAGVRNAAPLATITGVAPKAFLGNYKIFGTPGVNDTTTDAVILKAIDDAVSDGMDVINLSFGDDVAPRFDQDLEVQAIERATKVGVIVVVAAGNNGPDLNTISTPATAPSAITASASTNDRTFAASVDASGIGTFLAITGDGVLPGAPITDPFIDVANADGSGLACATLPSNSLSGAIALILRGSCTFETKLLNAQRAGAMAAIVYATSASPSPIGMSVGTATLPAQMVSNPDGTAIKQAISSRTTVIGTMRFTLGLVSVTPNLLTDFGAAGPNVDLGIKPDLLAVGSDVYTATQTFDSKGDMYSPDGFILVDGTSFSSPLVAGAAALIKAARPGLTVDQYRSILINSAMVTPPLSGVQQSGAGVLDATAALRATAAAFPTSLSFGAGGADLQASRTVTISNVGTVRDTFLITAQPRDGQPSPSITNGTVVLDPGASTDIAISWNTTGLAAGAYEGVVAIAGVSTGTLARVPYWYAVSSSTPVRITILDSITTARRNSLQRDAVLWRVTDGAGVPIVGSDLHVSIVQGGGQVQTVNSHDTDVPGMYGVDLRMSPVSGETMVVRLQAGSVTVDVSMAAQ